MSPAAFLQGARCQVRSGRYQGRVGTISNPPGKAWPDARGFVGVTLDKVRKTDSLIPALFLPSQIELV